MIVCLDTNTLLQAARPGNPCAPIIEAWLSRRFRWAVSNSILLEYQEVITRQSGGERWRQLNHVFDLAEARGDLLIHCQPAFQFHVISTDADDNKFCDCAITAGADYVVTEDADFAALANAGYKPKPIVPQEFIARHLARR